MADRLDRLEKALEDVLPGDRARLKCYVVPNRTEKRVFNAKAAARICCYATRAGASFADIERRYRQICTDVARRDKAQAEVALEAAAANIEANQNTLGEAYRAFQIINGILSVLGLLTRFLPQTRAASLGAAAGRAGVLARMSSIEVQQAANNRTFAIVRDAAANEARFRMTGT